ncbi:DUF2863 family protein [Massilia sp. DWR3-1-1]|uniref:DUF2863 family protein n=1 Tax=Massilia sp. DWR3-1-1 TaxID=2804559 RepID=UPI003CEEB207
MPKNKPPVRRTPGPRPAPTVDRTDELVEDLAVLALAVSEQEEADPAALAQQRDELQKMVRNALRKKQDEVLYGAIEHARFDDVDAYVLLRGQIEEAAASIVLRAAGKPAEEIDAFLVPMFVNSDGGLVRAEGFQDAAGFELLRASFQQAGLEAESATVVLISHLYDVDEIDRISYCELNEMLREVAATMGEKKLVATPALSNSIAAPDADASVPAPGTGERATELRFLLGFVRRRLDDPFYAIAADEDGANAWFDARLERYRQWTLEADPLLRACLAADPASVAINFLYQNQFFAARRQAMAEGEILLLMSQLSEAMADHALDPAQAGAVVGAVALDADVALRVALYRNGDAAPLANVELAFDLAEDLQGSVDELCEILHSMGIGSLSTAARFGADGLPQGLRPYQPD